MDYIEENVSDDVLEERQRKLLEIFKPPYFETLFYFDIETTTQYKDIETFEKDDKYGFRLFKKKWEKYKDTHPTWNKTLEESYINKAPLYAEYNKIINVSFAYFNKGEFRIKSIHDDSEEKIIEKCDRIFSNVNGSDRTLCGYNIKIFDLPIINKKYFKYDIKKPNNINFSGKKPWEIKVEDIFEEWKSNNIDYVSLDEVCYTLGLESPKEILSGEDVYKTYWLENDINKIVEYCEGELVAMSKVAEILYKHKKY